MSGGAAVFIPLSGGIQPLMIKSSQHFAYIGLYNAYLEDNETGRKLMMFNAHPSCTDFFSWARMHEMNISWLPSVTSVNAYISAWKASYNLTKSTLLKLGETEPWVINSERNPEVYKKKLGVHVVPISSAKLYERIKAVPLTDVKEMSAKWLDGSTSSAVDIKYIQDACRVYVAIKDLMKEHNASGVSLACFRMAKELGITGCLALSMLNSSLGEIGACEGDLEAAITLMLLKKLGNNFVWVANPIIRSNEVVDLTHCTAPTSACGRSLDYKILNHHETGLSAATEVKLPGEQTLTMVRIGNKLSEMVWHTGKTERIEKLPSCHTQIRVHLDGKKEPVATLMGTHFVQAYGDWSEQLAYCADFLGLSVCKN